MPMVRTNRPPGAVSCAPNTCSIRARMRLYPRGRRGKTDMRDHPNRRIRYHIILDRRRQQRHLTTILAPNIAHEKRPHRS
jgi:hypothetical protein